VLRTTVLDYIWTPGVFWREPDGRGMEPGCVAFAWLRKNATRSHMAYLTSGFKPTERDACGLADSDLNLRGGGLISSFDAGVFAPTDYVPV